MAQPILFNWKAPFRLVFGAIGDSQGARSNRSSSGKIEYGQTETDMPKMKWLELQTRIRTINSEYNDFEDKLDFLRAHNVT